MNQLSDKDGNRIGDHFRGPNGDIIVKSKPTKIDADARLSTLESKIQKMDSDVSTIKSLLESLVDKLST